MEYDLILARSVTYAQRMQRALNRAGIRSQLFRAPRDLTDLGCAYVVRISPYDLGAALPLLRRLGLGPQRIVLPFSFSHLVLPTERGGVDVGGGGVIKKKKRR